MILKHFLVRQRLRKAAEARRLALIALARAKSTGDTRTIGAMQLLADAATRAELQVAVSK